MWRNWFIMKIDKRKKPRSIETKDKISKKLKGRELNHKLNCQCCICKAKRNSFRKERTVKCLTCGKEFKTKNKKRKFCSRECYWYSGLNHPLSKKIKSNCIICEKEFYKLPESNKKYCSVTCQRKGHSIYLIEKYKDKVKKKYYCKDCGKEISGGATRCKKCFQKYWKQNIMRLMKKVKGREHGNWQNGISKEPYPFEFDRNLKEKIKKRDNYQCQNCGMTEEEHIIVYGVGVSIHHIDYNKKNIKEDNLISLCRQCHGRTNFNREYWQEYFEDKLKLLEEV